MNKKIMTLFLILFLTSLTCVSAENVTVSDHDISNDNITYGFNDLQTEIDSCDCEINLTHDYEFTDADDFGINIEKNIIINGNNHVIDAKNSSMIFDIMFSNVTISNLILKNANCAINAMDSELTTRNVRFINNTIEDFDGGAVCALNTVYHSIDDQFIDNYAKYGSAICIEDSSVLDLINGTFKSSFNLKWGLIAARYSEIRITNTTFANITSTYSGIIYGSLVKGLIKNTKFIDLHAQKTAGAVAIKGVDGKLTFENCSFTNSTSQKNGGALYLDLISEDMDIWNVDNIQDTVYLKNSQFINCSSDFGGAFVQLNGKLNINGCNFTDNTNAGYASRVDCTIKDSIFENNSKSSLYFDNGVLKVSKSEFTNSGEVYLWASKYAISQALFEKTDIKSFFDKNKCSIKDTTFINSKPAMNRKSYTDTISNDLSKIQTLKSKTFSANTANKKYFNLRDYGLVSSVKDQGDAGSCWVFATVSAYESALLKMGIDIDISENSVYNAALQYSPIGVEYLYDGGESIYATQYFLSWLGLAGEEENDYDELGRISKVPISNSYPHYSTGTVKFEYDIKDVKNALVKYGALFAPVYVDLSYINLETFAQYDYKHVEQNHAINIVGWNDSYSKYNFKKTPPKDGAWIVKNSWGKEWGYDGYYYISYYDLSLESYEVLGFEILPEIYNRIYQHDYFSEYFENEASFYVDGAKKIAYAQTYTSKGNDMVSAVGTYFEFEGEKYTVRILLNDREVYKQTGSSKHNGFRIIKLASSVSVNKNDKFTVEITRDNMAFGFISRVKYNTAESYYKIAGKKYAISDEIPVIKAYTTSNPIKSKNIVKYYAKSKTKYTISNIKAKKITIRVDGKKYTVKVKNRKASVKIGLKTGPHTVTASYKGKKITNQILVKTTIISKRTVKISQNAKKTLKIKFRTSTGKAIKNKKIRFKIDSKTLTLKTDKKGAFKLPVPSKLKKGRHYISLTNPKTKEKVKITLKIV